MDAAGDRDVRYLGAAFLAVFVTSLAAALLSGQVFSGDISAVLVNLSENVAVVRASNVCQLLTSIGIIALAALLYVVVIGSWLVARGAGRRVLQPGQLLANPA